MSQPRVRSTTHRTREHLEACGDVGSLDDLDGPLADGAQGVLELLARIAGIGEDVPDPGEALADGRNFRRNC